MYRSNRPAGQYLTRACRVVENHLKTQCLYSCTLGFGRGTGVLNPFLNWVVNFDWTSGILIQLLIGVVNYCQNLYLHPMVVKAKRCVSITTIPACQPSGRAGMPVDRRVQVGRARGGQAQLGETSAKDAARA